MTPRDRVILVAMALGTAAWVAAMCFGVGIVAKTVFEAQHPAQKVMLGECVADDFGYCDIREYFAVPPGATCAANDTNGTRYACYVQGKRVFIAGKPHANIRYVIDTKESQ